MSEEKSKEVNSDIPKEFTAEYYDEHYFRTPCGKHFRTADGSPCGWSYNNETGEFLGAKDIVKAWSTIFKPKNMLSIGEGRGTFLAYARDLGIEAFGFDYSKYAVSDEGRYPRCKAEWLIRHDATEPWPYLDRSFDLVVGLDILEHIYEIDLPKVVDEMFHVANKYIFLQIATAGTGGLQGESKGGYTLVKGEPIPIGLEGCAVAGHVNVRDQEFWYNVFDREDWMVRRDLREWFVGLVDPNIIRNWLLNTIIVLERVE